MKAKWIAERGVVTPGGDPYYICSNCRGGGHLHGVESYTPHPNYCPDCGAKMENGECDEES